MKKAFTLIELLVVIAIIAILAAILFPVFAQAKAAAKKAASISNQKQIGLSIIMYSADYDDVYPRNDDCQPGSSLNPDLNSNPFNANGAGCTGAGPYYYRMNHYAWQKWVMPYVKNFGLFVHPAIDYKQFSNWGTNGELMGSYALNLSITGALNTYGSSINGNGAFRNSWLGGSQTNVPDVAQTMLLMELVDPTVNFAPVFLDSSSGTQTRTAYPFAVREAWIPKFYATDSSCNQTSTTPDASRVPFAQNINLSYCDGHTKTIAVGRFLANTPTAAQYSVSSRPACGIGTGAWTISAKPVWTQPWPQWGLE
ncbi:MAG: prepilin-type N-terminal cleavage/methylation domain-containing protein [Armatimonadetes bacterium]|nr:prepilin-type N-terminal cleavage/methylation domain-containing protein [Armatimonadota bacterium]MBS1727874.1 prepilin-type N-terminal cleavage/methylation domain-containing protein [Armatimonadota bacterium]